MQGRSILSPGLVACRVAAIAVVTQSLIAGCASQPPARSSPTAQVVVGGDEIVVAFDAELKAAATAVKRHVKAQGVERPWTLMSQDGRALMVEDLSADRLLVWNDWTSGEPPTVIEGVRDARLVSTRHFVSTRHEEYVLAAISEPESTVSIDRRFAPLRLRVFPATDTWASVIEDRVYIGTISTGVDPERATTLKLPEASAQLAAIEEAGVLLVETSGSRIVAIDVDSCQRIDEVHGNLLWPFSTQVHRGEASAFNEGVFAYARDSVLWVSIGADQGIVTSVVASDLKHDSEVVRLAENYRGIVWPPGPFGFLGSGTREPFVPYTAFVPRPDAWKSTPSTRHDQ